MPVTGHEGRGGWMGYGGVQVVGVEKLGSWGLEAGVE